MSHSNGTNGVQATPAKDETLIIYGDDGQIYILKGTDWKVAKYRQDEASQNGAAGVVEQLVKLGTYLAYVPPDFAQAIGVCCVLVNMKAVLQNQVPVQPSARAAHPAPYTRHDGSHG